MKLTHKDTKQVCEFDTVDAVAVFLGETPDAQNWESDSDVIAEIGPVGTSATKPKRKAAK